MANRKHLAKLEEGVESWNQWRLTHAKTWPNLHGAELRGANLSRANLRDADLQGADLCEAKLSYADLRKGILDETDLNGADLRGAILEMARLPKASLDSADLSKANLCGALLPRANLRGANLSAASIRMADLRWADLTLANLSETILIKSDLALVNLTRACLNSADLTGVNLEMVDLTQADVVGTKFMATRVDRTSWCDLDLSEAVGLESIVHHGPSSVGIDTLARSKGRIPDAFLRGCGVPEHIIAMQKSLAGDIAPIQFYSCFISYSHQDEEFCRRLHSRMQQERLRVWFAPEDMKGGKKLHDQIDEAIRVYDKLLLVLSEASMGSEWVGTEIRKARKRERSDKRQVLFPIRLVDFEAIRAWERFDADSGKDVAAEIREYFIPDFSNWKDHDAFEAAFARLLKDLKASA